MTRAQHPQAEPDRQLPKILLCPLTRGGLIRVLGRGRDGTASASRTATIHRRRRDTSGAARTNSLAVASSRIHRAIARYETGIQELSAPAQSAEATGRSSFPRAFSPPRTSVHRSDENAPRPSASTTACCSVAPRPMVPGMHENKRMTRLADLPSDEVRSVLITTIRSTPAAIDSCISNVLISPVEVLPHAPTGESC